METALGQVNDSPYYCIVELVEGVMIQISCYQSSKKCHFYTNMFVQNFLLILLSEGAFLVSEIHVFIEPLNCSLCWIACITHSAHSLFSALLCYTRSTCTLRFWTRSLSLPTSLWVGWKKIRNFAANKIHVPSGIP